MARYGNALDIPMLLGIAPGWDHRWTSPGVSTSTRAAGRNAAMGARARWVVEAMVGSWRVTFIRKQLDHVKVA